MWISLGSMRINQNNIPAGLLFVLFSFIASAPFFVFGSYSASNGDMRDVYFSYWHQLGNLWDFNSLCGFYFRAESQFSIWEVFSTIMPGWLLTATYVWLRYFVVTYFTYRLLRFRFGVGQVGGYVGALLMFAHYMSVYPAGAGWTLLPAVLEMFFWISEKRHRIISLIIAFGSGVLYASASPTFEQPFALFFVFIFMMISRREVIKRTYLHVVIFLIGWSIIAVPSLIALQQTIPFAVRTYKLESSLVDNIFSNIFFCTNGDRSHRPYIEFLLILSALLITRFRHPMARKAVAYLLFFEAFYIVVVYGLGLLGTVWTWVNAVGFGRLYMWTPFVFSFCAALAVDAIERPGIEIYSLRRRICMIVIAIASLCLFYTQIMDRAYEWKTYGSYAYQNNARIFDVLAGHADQTYPYRTALINTPKSAHVGLLHGAFHTRGLATFTGVTHLATVRLDNYWDAMNNRNSSYDKNSQKPVWLYLDLPISKDTHSIDISEINTAMLALANVRYLVSQYPLIGENVIEFHRPGMPPMNKLTLIERAKANFSGRNDLYLYELKYTLPRLYIARNLRVFDNDTEMLSVLSEAPASAFRETVFLSRADGPVEVPVANDIQGQADLISQGNDEYVISLNVSGPTYLMISNSFNDRWECVNQDGKMLQMRPAFHLFTAIMVNKEDRTVSCSFSMFN